MLAISIHLELFLSCSIFKVVFESKFWRQCLSFYQVSTQDIFDYLPCKNKLIEYAQYLLPLKHTDTSSNGAINNSSLTIKPATF